MSNCQECFGTGRVFVGEQAWRFCDCTLGQADRRRLLLEASGIPRARWGETFEAFRPEPGTKKCLSAARRFAEGRLCWLLLYGGVGNGKSHLAHAAGLYLIDQGKTVRVVNTFCLLSELRSNMGSPSLGHRMRELGSIPYLMLDEFFWATDWEGQRLEEVIQRRYMEKLPLLVTTNKDLATIPVPILSRFKEMGDAVQDSGKDMRGV